MTTYVDFCKHIHTQRERKKERDKEIQRHESRGRTNCEEEENHQVGRGMRNYNGGRVISSESLVYK